MCIASIGLISKESTESFGGALWPECGELLLLHSVILSDLKCELLSVAATVAVAIKRCLLEHVLPSHYQRLIRHSSRLLCAVSLYYVTTSPRSRCRCVLGHSMT